MNQKRRRYQRNKIIDLDLSDMEVVSHHHEEMKTIANREPSSPMDLDSTQKQNQFIAMKLDKENIEAGIDDTGEDDDLDTYGNLLGNQVLKETQPKGHMQTFSRISQKTIESVMNIIKKKTQGSNEANILNLQSANGSDLSQETIGEGSQIDLDFLRPSDIQAPLKIRPEKTLKPRRPNPKKLVKSGSAEPRYQNTQNTHLTPTKPMTIERDNSQSKESSSGGLNDRLTSPEGKVNKMRIRRQASIMPNGVIASEFTSSDDTFEKEYKLKLKKELEKTEFKALNDLNKKLQKKKLKIIKDDDQNLKEDFMESVKYSDNQAATIMQTQSRIKQLEENEHKVRFKGCLCFDKSMLIPYNSTFKSRWDSLIIILSVWNSWLIPYEAVYPSFKTIPLEILDRFIDVLFFGDILITFRSVYKDSRTDEDVKDGKRIAINYIFYGSFFLDVLASIPLELVILVQQDSADSVKFLGMLKLVRLLRLRRIMKKGFAFSQFGAKIAQLAFFLILVIHWINCAWYYVAIIEKSWVPAKDLDSGETDIFTANYFDIYVDMMYYAVLLVMAGDPIPTTTHELHLSIALIFVATIIISIVMGEFSSIMSGLTKQERLKNENLDIINNAMLGLRLNEDLQDRILQYYEDFLKAPYVKDMDVFLLVGANISAYIKAFQMFQTLSKIKFIESNNVHQIESLASRVNVAMYQPGDVIIKQGDEADYFYFIDKGNVEVCLELEDFLYWENKHTERFLGRQFDMDPIFYENEEHVESSDSEGASSPSKSKKSTKRSNISKSEQSVSRVDTVFSNLDSDRLRRRDNVVTRHEEQAAIEDKRRKSIHVIKSTTIRTKPLVKQQVVHQEFEDEESLKIAPAPKFNALVKQTTRHMDQSSMFLDPNYLNNAQAQRELKTPHFDVPDGMSEVSIGEEDSQNSVTEENISFSPTKPLQNKSQSIQAFTPIKEHSFMDHSPPQIKHQTSTKPHAKRKEGSSQSLFGFLKKGSMNKTNKTYQPDQSELISLDCKEYRNASKNEKMRIKEKRSQIISQLSSMEQEEIKKQDDEFKAKVILPAELQRQMTNDGPNKGIFHLNKSNLDTSTAEDRYIFLRKMKSGDYFGELSLLGNLNRTSTCIAVSKVACGYLTKTDFLQHMNLFHRAQNIVQNKVMRYKDEYFETLHKMLMNVGWFRNLTHDTLRNLSMKLQWKKINDGATIIEYREISPMVYFIYKGEASVNAYDENTNESFHFEKLNRGSCVNLVSTILGQESIFQFIAGQKTEVYSLSLEDIQKVANENESLQLVLEVMRSVYGSCGIQFDYHRFVPYPTRESQITTILKKINSKYLSGGNISGMQAKQPKMSLARQARRKELFYKIKKKIIGLKTIIHQFKNGFPIFMLIDTCYNKRTERIMCGIENNQLISILDYIYTVTPSKEELKLARRKRAKILQQINNQGAFKTLAKIFGNKNHGLQRKNTIELFKQDMTTDYFSPEFIDKQKKEDEIIERSVRLGLVEIPDDGLDIHQNLDIKLPLEFKYILHLLRMFDTNSIPGAPEHIRISFLHRMIDKKDLKPELFQIFNVQKILKLAQLKRQDIQNQLIKIQEVNDADSDKLLLPFLKGKKVEQRYKLQDDDSIEELQKRQARVGNTKIDVQSINTISSQVSNSKKHISNTGRNKRGSNLFKKSSFYVQKSLVDSSIDDLEVPVEQYRKSNHASGQSIGNSELQEQVNNQFSSNNDIDFRRESRNHIDNELGTQLSVDIHSTDSVHESSMTTVKNINVDNNSNTHPSDPSPHLEPPKSIHGPPKAYLRPDQDTSIYTISSLYGNTARFTQRSAFGASVGDAQFKLNTIRNELRVNDESVRVNPLAKLEQILERQDTDRQHNFNQLDESALEKLSPKEQFDLLTQQIENTVGNGSDPSQLEELEKKVGETIQDLNQQCLNLLESTFQRIYQNRIWIAKFKSDKIEANIIHE